MKRMLIIVLAAALAGGAEKDAEAERLLKAASNKELVDGDIKGAIEQYKKVAQRKNRAAAAQALVKMGECYEKLGDTEARKAYERVVREYGDQKESVEVARGHLAGKGGSEKTAMSARLIQDNRWGWYGPSVSRDGRYIADRHAVAGLDGPQLRLHDLVTGEVRLLVKVNPGERRLEYPLVSPDGRHVAYGSTPQPNGPSEIYVVETGGSSPRLIFKGGRPLAWSPDGRQILAVLRRGNGPERVLLPVSGGDPVRIGTGEMSDGRFSPDGNQIVIVKPRKPGDRNSDIFLQSLKDGAEIPLIENYGNATAPVYWPDGKRLLFLSDHAGSQDLWSIPLVNGTRGGAPELVKQHVHKLLGVTDAGECYYQTAFLGSTLYTAVLDGQSGTMTSRQKAITDRDFNLGGAWSPDGEYLAYTAEVGALPRIQLEVVIRSMKTGEERRLGRNQFPNVDLAEQTPQWFPDSRSLLLRTWTGKLYRFDMRTSDLQSLLEGVSLDDDRSRSARLAPDGHTIYYASRDAKAQETRILKRELAGGAETEICRLKQYIAGSFAVSPDGSRLVFPVRDKEPGSAIMTIATAGGSPKELYRSPKRPIIFDPIWIADGRWVLFTRQYDDVYSIRAAGGEPQPLGVGPMSFVYINSVHPDGKQFVMTDENGGRQLWVLKNLFGKTASK